MNKGFTLFFAMLVGSLALAVGLAIFDLTLRELQLSSVATQSQYAIYAADTGAECALYWDAQCPLGSCVAGSAFATSSNTNGGTFPPPAGSGVLCNAQDITSVWTTATPVAPTPTAATTTFTITLSPQIYCAIVTVAKSGNPSQTTIISHGYNTCAPGPLQLERVLQVNY